MLERFDEFSVGLFACCLTSSLSSVKLSGGGIIVSAGIIVKSCGGCGSSVSSGDAVHLLTVGINYIDTSHEHFHHSTDCLSTHVICGMTRLLVPGSKTSTGYIVFKV